VLPVEIVPIDRTTLVLRARGSELLILPQHIGHLKACKTPKEFTGYFMDEALLNRPARKLFEAWLRKDRSLWQRIYSTIQKEMDATAEGDEAEKPAAKADAPKTKATASQHVEKAKTAAKTGKPKAEEKPEAKKTAKPATKKTEKEEKTVAAKKPAAKAEPAKKTAKKAAAADPKKTKKTTASAPAKKKTKAKKKG